MSEGGVPTLEMQVLVPLQEPSEMAHNIVTACEELALDYAVRPSGIRPGFRPLCADPSLGHVSAQSAQWQTALGTAGNAEPPFLSASARAQLFGAEGLGATGVTRRHCLPTMALPTTASMRCPRTPGGGC